MERITISLGLAPKQFVEHELAIVAALAQTARSLGPLEHDRAMAGRGEQPGERGPRDSGADDMNFHGFLVVSYLLLWSFGL